MSLSPQLNPDQAAESVETLTQAEHAPGEAGGRFRRKNTDNASKSPSRIAWERLRRDKVAIFCSIIVIFFLLMAIFAPLLASWEGQDPNLSDTNLVDLDGNPIDGPNSEHWLGVTPKVGRDIFARYVYGVRPSLAIAVFAAIGTTLVGLVLGLLAGYFGGWVDKVVSWWVDFLLSLPFLLFAIGLVPIVQSWFGNPFTITAETTARVRFGALIFILLIFGWATMARLTRSTVISLRESEFIQAARVLGVPTRRILFKEMVPNLVGVTLVFLTMAVPTYISSEAGLSYLGVGLQDPIASWGNMIADAQKYYATQPLYLWVPVISVALLVLALSLLGDAVADAFNPSTRR